MPIPGSILNGLAIDPSLLGDTFYPSRATFLGITKTKAAGGQELHSFDVIDEAHTDIPCRKAPIILVRPQNQEHDLNDVDLEIQRFQVNLVRWLPDILDTWQVSIDDRDTDGNVLATTVFEIQSIEGDGNSVANRLIVAAIKPFNQ